MNFDDLRDEVKAKALECKSSDELLKLAEDEGVELTDEQLETIAGGDWDDPCDQYSSW